MTKTVTLTIESPVGPLGAVLSDNGVMALNFDAEGSTQTPNHPLGAELTGQLNAYFAGGRTSFDLPLAPRGTEFESLVWQELTKIPFGETRSYADIARAIGNPAAVRAVGRANGRNPLPILVPCHRVIGSDGCLTGFGGGLERKRWLLDFEGAGAGLFADSLIKQ